MDALSWVTPTTDAKRAMLVYQAGIANVFAVQCFNLSAYGRDAQRLIQGPFEACEYFARGMACAGAEVKVAACNQAGDITHAHWSEDFENQPFCESYSPYWVQLDHEAI